MGKDKQPSSKPKSKSGKGKGSVSGPSLPVGETHMLIQKGKRKNTVGPEASLYLTAALEYIASEIIEKSGNVAAAHSRSTIELKDLVAAIHADPELKKMYGKSVSEEAKKQKK